MVGQTIGREVLSEVPLEVIDPPADTQMSASITESESSFLPPALPNTASGTDDALGADGMKVEDDFPEMTEEDIDAQLKELQERSTKQPLVDRLRLGTNDMANEVVDTAGRETIRQRYPDGRTHVLRQVAQDAAGNYYKDGAWRAFNRNGDVVAEGQFKRDQMTGQWRRYHNAQSGGLFSTAPFNKYKGRFLSVANFDAGKLDGMWTIYDQQNQKAFEVPYTKGKRNGTATWWYPSASKMREATFRDGLLDGEVREWDEQNKLTRREEFIKGQRVVRNVSLYRPDRPREEQFYLDAKLKLDGEDQWWEARPAAFESSGQRVQHGPIRRWFENGQPKMQGQYQNDQRVGKFVWWHANGGRKLLAYYRDGQKTDSWTWWHANGMKSIQGEYEADQAVGLWTWWDEKGRIKRQEDFTKRKRQQAGATGELSEPTRSSERADVSESATRDAIPANPATLDGQSVGEFEEESDGEGLIPLLLDDSELEEIGP